MAVRLGHQVGEPVTAGNTVVPSRLSNRNVLDHARRLAGHLLKSIDYDPTRSTIVPLNDCAEYLQASIKSTAGTSIKVYGALWASQPAQPELFGDFEIAIARSGYPGRFTLAHELAHRAADTWLTKAELSTWTFSQKKLFFDGFAGHLLLPDELLLTVLPVSNGQQIELSLSALKHLRSTFHVSYSCLIKRLNDLTVDRRLALRNVIFSAAAAVSATKRTDYAPRVIVASTPIGFFIPANTRLKSLGLSSLADLYWAGTPYTESYSEENIHITARNNWKLRNMKCMFQYVIFVLNHGGRLMLAAELSDRRRFTDDLGIMLP
jgi:hypothetical protein